MFIDFERSQLLTIELLALEMSSCGQKSSTSRLTAVYISVISFFGALRLRARRALSWRNTLMAGCLLCLLNHWRTRSNLDSLLPFPYSATPLRLPAFYTMKSIPSFGRKTSLLLATYHSDTPPRPHDEVMDLSEYCYAIIPLVPCPSDLVVGDFHLSFQVREKSYLA